MPSVDVDLVKQRNPIEQVIASHGVKLQQRGERFVNESTSYHLFGLAMQAADRHAPSIPAWLVCDAEALARYGLGMIRPGAKEGASIAPFLADGYLTQGRTVAELAAKMGADPAVLTATIERFNAAAERGVDAEFQRGSTDYQRANGDATRSAKNPCLGALRTGPYYAIRLYPGDTGTAGGLAIAIVSGWVIGRLRLESWLEGWVRELRIQAAELPTLALTPVDRIREYVDVTREDSDRSDIDDPRAAGWRGGRPPLPFRGRLHLPPAARQGGISRMGGGP